MRCDLGSEIDRRAGEDELRLLGRDAEIEEHREILLVLSQAESLDLGEQDVVGLDVLVTDTDGVHCCQRP